MNWKRIKTFLIILFLIINIYLISTTSGNSIIRTAFVTKVDKETVSKTVKVISDNYAISISESMIPDKFVNLSNIDVTNLMFDDSIEKSKLDFVQTESGFECEIKTRTYSYTEDIAKKEISVILSDIGINPETYKMSFKKTDYGLMCYVNEYVSGYPIFDGRIRAEFTSSLIKLKGNWYLPQQTDVKKYDTFERLTDITSVLLDCASRVSLSAEEKPKIKSIDYGYFVSYYGDDIVTKSSSAIPSYMIETSEGTRYYYDAYNGNFLKQEE